MTCPPSAVLGSDMRGGARLVAAAAAITIAVCSACGSPEEPAVSSPPEPAPALPQEALQTGANKQRADEKVCLVICGANLDPSTLA